MLRFIRGALAATLAICIAAAVSSCGTVLVTSEFVVSVDDPAGRLPSTVNVSVFDSTMGQSAEWASESMGTASAVQPYTTSFKSTATKFIGDNGPPQDVRAGLAIPQLQPKGYFAIQLKPVDGQTATVTAPFIGYYDYNVTTDGKVEPLVLKVTSTAGNLTWQFKIAASIPPAK